MFLRKFRIGEQIIKDKVRTDLTQASYQAEIKNTYCVFQAMSSLIPVGIRSRRDRETKTECFCPNQNSQENKYSCKTTRVISQNRAGQRSFQQTLKILQDFLNHLP